MYCPPCTPNLPLEFVEFIYPAFPGCLAALTYCMIFSLSLCPSVSSSELASTPAAPVLDMASRTLSGPMPPARMNSRRIPLRFSQANVSPVPPAPLSSRILSAEEASAFLTSSSDVILNALMMVSLPPDFSRSLLTNASDSCPCSCTVSIPANAVIFRMFSTVSFTKTPTGLTADSSILQSSAASCGLMKRFLPGTKIKPA